MNTDSSQFITGREVTVPDMLNARDRRHAIQQELIRTHGATVISFTLNVPGPVKIFPLGEMTFEEGVRLIDSQLHAWKIPVLEKRTIRDFTGNEQFWSVKGDDLFIKETLCLLEDSLSFGRLFDIDVIRTDETKVSRTELGFPGRKCLLCSNDAFVCSRSRTHTVKELLDKACELMKDYFEEKQAKKLSSLSMQALLYEVSATPKPGLVDRNNTGAHKDMDIFTFEASAVSLNHYFEKFALCGMEKGVEALICGQMRRNGHHEVRIDDRNRREAFFAAAADLFLAVGDDGERVGLGAGAGRGRDRDKGQTVLRHAFAAARAAVDVVPPVAVVGRHDRDGLRGVDGRAAAQTDDERDLFAAAERRAFAHAFDGRIGLYLVVNERFMTGFLENAGDLRHIAELCRGRAARDDQAAALGQTRTRELAHRAAAEKQPGRHVKTENTHVAASLKKGAERLPCTSWIFDIQASVYTAPNNIIIANCGFKEKSKMQRKWSEYLVHYAKKNYAKNA